RRPAERERHRLRQHPQGDGGAGHQPGAGDPAEEEIGVLRIQKLNKIYPNGTHALRDVSLEVESGEFLVIIGLSGSGKSTLMRCINRLIEPTSGRIELDGMDVTAASPVELRRIRARIGMIFQQFNLVRRASVLTNVLAG